MSDVGRPDPTGTRAMLASLLGDTLDPGYRAAAERRDRAGDAPPPQRVGRVLVVVGALLIGLLIAVAYHHATLAAPSDARARQDLVRRIQAAGVQASSLASQAGGLGRAVNARRDSVLGSSTDLTPAEAAAGTTAVHGPGVVVTLGSAPSTATTTSSERPGSTPLSQVSQLTDLDVRAVVNELWKDGAEAIAINGVRLTPTSAIRFAGQAVLVDLQPVEAPYRIDAIGDRDTLSTRFTTSDVAARYRTRSSVGGYRFDTSTSGRLDLPAASSGGGPRYASTIPSSTPSRPRATPSSPGVTPS